MKSTQGFQSPSFTGIYGWTRLNAVCVTWTRWVMMYSLYIVEIKQICMPSISMSVWNALFFVGCIWCFPTLAREFQGFNVWGKFVFRTLELMVTPTNLAKQVKVGHTLDQSHSVQSRGPERARQSNAQSWRSQRTNRRLSKEFWAY